MSKIKTIIFICKFYFLYFLVKCIYIYYSLVSAKKPTKDILYLESTPEDGAGYTYRVKHWMNLLNNDGITTESLFLIRSTKDFFKETSSKNLQKFVIKSIILRIKQIHYSRNFKVLIVRRSLVIYNQYGSHFMEKLLKVAHPNRILDFDDDIGSNKIYEKKNSFFQNIMLTRENHFYDSFKYYNGFFTGSEYLKQILIDNNTLIDSESIQVIPTCVNYDVHEPKEFVKKSVLTFGWIGGNQNLFLLNNIIPALNIISKNNNIELIIMAGVNTYSFDANFPVIFNQYSLEAEVDFIKKIDVGLMPLNNDSVSKGKCGFKLIQYMGLGVPGIASAITVNKEIIQNDWNGWLVNKEEDWTIVLQKVVSKKSELSKYGNTARATVLGNYTFMANYSNYKKFIKRYID